MASDDPVTDNAGDDNAGDDDAGTTTVLNGLHRPTDNRMLAGVCAAAADWLRIDPVIVRVITAVLAVIGPAGWILYAAGWLVIPSADQRYSPAARALGIHEHADQLMRAGLIIAGILAAGALVGTPVVWGAWTWPWVVLAALVWIFVIRPRARNDNASGEFTASRTMTRARHPHSPVLSVITLLGALIAVSATWLWDELIAPVELSTYLLIALGVVTIGVLIGTTFGDAGLLIGIGVVVACALAVSLLPRPAVGEVHVSPDRSSVVLDTYENGVGELTVDLSDVTDPDKLRGRHIDIRQEVGETRVLVPDDIPVHAVGRVTVGNSELFGSRSSDTRVHPRRTSGDESGGTLELTIHQSVGNIEVTRQ